MGSILAKLIFPIFSLILLTLGMGLFSTFISIRLDLAGITREWIGVITSAYYSGILIGSLRSPVWLSRLGHLRALIALCAANSALILLHALWIDPIYWTFLRFLSGFVMGALFVVIESWFLLLGTASMRNQLLSVYLFMFYIALSLGQLLLNVADPHSLIPYCLASTFSSLAILPIVITTIEIPAHTSTQSLSLIQIFSTSPKGFIGGIISGMLLACIYGLCPIYGQDQGLSISDVATVMSVIVFGGVSLQWPLAKWADNSGRQKVLIIACFIASLISGVIAWVENPSWAIRLILLWLFGGFSFVLYPLSMGLSCEGFNEEQIIKAAGGFVLAYGIGAMSGPLIAPIIMNWIGSPGLFYFNSSICFLLGCIGIVPLKNRSLIK